MTNTTELYGQLKEAVEGNAGAAFRSRQILTPSAGWDNPVLRAAVYSDGLDGKPGPIVNQVGDKKVVLIESYEARAHRILESIKRLRDEGIALPVFELYVDWEDNEPKDLIFDSFSANHHVTDACWREALEPQPGQDITQFPRFLAATGKPLNPVHPLHPADVLRLYPTALLTGYDPRSMILSAQANSSNSQRASRGASQTDDNGDDLPATAAKPWGRLVQSSLTAVIEGDFWRGSGLIRHRRANGTVYVKEGEVLEWTSSEKEAKKDARGEPIRWQSKTKDGETKGDPGRPSLIGLDSVTPTKRKVPDVWAKEISLTSYLSISRLKQLRFCDNPAADSAARLLLASLGVAGIVLADDLLSPRSDCDLVRAPDNESGTGKSLNRELVYQGKVESLDNLDQAVAVDLVRHAITVVEEAQRVAGITLWEPFTLKLVARKDFRGILQKVQ